MLHIHWAEDYYDYIEAPLTPEQRAELKRRRMIDRKLHMNLVGKDEIVDKMVEKTGYPRHACRHAYTAMAESIMESVAEGKTVRVRGFATFFPKRRQKYEGRNPQTGENITVEERIVPRILFGKTFRRIVANWRP